MDSMGGTQRVCGGSKQSFQLVMAWCFLSRSFFCVRLVGVARLLLLCLPADTPSAALGRVHLHRMWHSRCAQHLFAFVVDNCDWHRASCSAVGGRPRDGEVWSGDRCSSGHDILVETG